MFRICRKNYNNPLRGLCLYCNQPADNKTRCKKHQIKLSKSLKERLAKNIQIHKLITLLKDLVTSRVSQQKRLQLQKTNKNPETTFFLPTSYSYCSSCGKRHRRKSNNCRRCANDLKMAGYPYCVKCRVQMRATEKKRDRLFYRCKKCGIRVITGEKRRLIDKPQHLADCINCRRGLIKAGNQNKYLKCINCKYLVKRSGIALKYTSREFLASCLSCKGRMEEMRSRGEITSYYCPGCKRGMRHRYIRKPPVLDKDLYVFVSSFVPETLYFEVRDEIILDIYLDILKTRRAKNGYGLMPNKLNSEIVNKYIKAAKRKDRQRYFTEFSIDSNYRYGEDGKRPFSETLVG